MKNLLSSVFLASLFLTGCQEGNDPAPRDAQTKESSVRTIEEALLIAEKAPSLFTDGTRSSAKKSLTADDVLTIRHHQTRGNLGVNDDAALYIVNYPDNEGYVVISANPAAEEILGFIEEGTFSPQSDNSPEFTSFLELASNYVSQNSHSLPLLPINPSETIVLTQGIHLSTKWGKHDPEGLYCPNFVSGCASTAMAQIMAYYEFPTSMDMTYPSPVFPSVTYNWTDMKKHKIRHNKDGISSNTLCLATEEGHQSISALCRQLGQIAQSSYNNDSTTGTSPNYIEYTLVYYGYMTSGWRYYSDTCLVQPIRDSHPVIVCGFSPIVGHVWIVDGYKEFRTTYQVPTLAGTPPSYATESRFYNHINWGWDGQSNGYFLDNVFCPGNSESLDPNPYDIAYPNITFNHISYLVAHP